MCRSRRYSNGALRCRVRNVTLRSPSGDVCRGAGATACISRPCECSQLRYITTFSSSREASCASGDTPERAVRERWRSEYSISRAAFHFGGAARCVEAAAITGISYCPAHVETDRLHNVAFHPSRQRLRGAAKENPTAPLAAAMTPISAPSPHQADPHGHNAHEQSALSSRRGGIRNNSLAAAYGAPSATRPLVAAAPRKTALSVHPPALSSPPPLPSSMSPPAPPTSMKLRRPLSSSLRRRCAWAAKPVPAGD